MIRTRHSVAGVTGMIRSFSTQAAGTENGNRRGGDSKLYQRLSALGATGGSVTQALNEYTREKSLPTKYQLQKCIKGLRKYKMYNTSLEIMEWMDMMKINLSHADDAIRLDLISKTKGLTAAENYFNSLSPLAKNRHTYGALLNCYCKEKMEDKALALFEEMDKMGISSTPLAYNNLMTLYMRLAQPEKVPLYILKMKDNGIPLHTYTYNIWMLSLSCLDDIEGLERVFDEMTRDKKEECDWTTYSNLACAYVKAGLHEKADAALRKLEEKNKGNPSREAFHFLISLNAKMSNSGEVQRIWRSLKATLNKTTNTSYLVMLQALRKLNEIDGLTKLYKEWESSCYIYDSKNNEREVSQLIVSTFGKYYEEERDIEDAEKFCKILKDKKCLDHKTFDWFVGCEATFTRYDSKNDEWTVSPLIVSTVMKYFEEEVDIEGAEKFRKILKDKKCLDIKTFRLLVQTAKQNVRCARGDEMRP